MMSTLYLLKFKNYYNRKAERYSTVNEYTSKTASWVVQTNYDFNPNDGIWANAIVNTSFENADYLLVVDNKITSRWYIIEATRRRLGQYQLKLLRDVVADFYDDVINAPTFIEKATVNYGNPLLFNKEDMSFNQIKTNETPLRDNTGCPWIVGYIDTKAEAKSITAPTNDNTSYKAEYYQLSDLPFYSLYSSDAEFKGNVSSVRVGLNYLYSVSVPSKFNKIIFNDQTALNQPFTTILDAYKYDGIQRASSLSTSGQDAIAAKVMSEAKSWYANNKVTIESTIAEALNLATDAQTESFLATYSEEGNIYKIGDKYYKCYRQTMGTSSIAKSPSSKDSLEYTYFNDNIVANIPSLTKVESRPNEAQYEMYASYTAYKIFIEELPNVSSYTVSVPAAGNRAHLQDAPYDMFAIPYPINRKVSVTTNDVTHPITNNVIAEASMAIAKQLVIDYASSIYDLQLLPYCPMQDMAYRNSVLINDDIYGENRDYSVIKYSTGSGSTNCSVILWCRQSQFSLTINKLSTQTSAGDRLTSIAIAVKEPKIEAMCDTYRLVSPNYNGQFEFNAVMNNGVEYFQVDCTYKPYNPYIRVAPNFKGLYGADFNDARGLICGGDFSLATLSDQWKQYEVNNKNYQNVFDRQIENMLVQNKYQRQTEILGAVTGAVSSGVMAGVGLGGTTGNPWIGLAAGAGAGTISGAAGAIDISINDKLRTEALDFTRDQFGYSLANIRALPNNLTKVSAFNINNKIFPILEYYTCTDTEKQALRDKIKYNGMSIGVIGTIAEYIQPEESYIKGRIIRLQDLGEDYHLAVAIAEEIYKGVFI